MNYLLKYLRLVIHRKIRYVMVCLNKLCFVVYYLTEVLIKCFMFHIASLFIKWMHFNRCSLMFMLVLKYDQGMKIIKKYCIDSEKHEFNLVLLYRKLNVLTLFR